MPTALKNLRVREISVVDAGANTHARVMLMKRADGEKPGMMDKLRAMLGIAKAADFEQAQAAIESGQYAGELLSKLDMACCALRDSVGSIMDDEEVTDKQGEIAKSFDQFKEHVAGLVPGEVEKAMRGAALVASNTAPTAEGEPGVTDTTEIAKQLAERDAELAKLRDELAIAKMSDAHKGYMAKMEGDKSSFAKMSDAEREAHMDKHPIKKAELPDDVRKALEESAELKKRLADLETERDKVMFAKRAAEIGLPEGEGEILRKAHGGDKAALGKMEQMLKAALAQANAGGVFKEFGSSRATDATSPEAQVMAKAAELRKADPKLSQAQAIAKVAADPANREVWQAYKRADIRAA